MAEDLRPGQATRAAGPRSVAVVGAGYAGLAAAVTLAQRGVRVTVFESGAVPGGRARRVSIGGHTLDNGQHVLIGAYTSLLGVMRTVGADPDRLLLRLPLELRYASGFRLRAPDLPAPLHLACALATVRGLGLAQRFAAMRFMHSMKKQDFHLATDVSVNALLARFNQTGAIARYLWQPLCVSALNTPPQEASANIFLRVLRDSLAAERAASDLLIPRVDLSSLFPEPAAAWLAAHGGELRTGTAVRELGPLAAAFDHVIVAVGPHQLATLIRGVVGGYSYQPIYTIYLQYPAAVRLDFPMLGLGEGSVQWVFDRGQLGGEAGLLACVISARGAHQRSTQHALAAAAHRELVRALGSLPAPHWSRVIAEKRATISCTPGLARTGPRTELPNVYLAGDYTEPDYPPTLEAAVRSGIRASRLIA